MTLARRIWIEACPMRERRLELGLSEPDLAHISEIGQKGMGAIHRIEHGKRHRRKWFTMLAQALEVDLVGMTLRYELWLEMRPGNDNSADSAKALARVRAFTPTQRGNVAEPGEVRGGYRRPVRDSPELGMWKGEVAKVREPGRGGPISERRSPYVIHGTQGLDERPAEESGPEPELPQEV